MKTCTANCAAYTPMPGDQFIFYGGDNWTVSNFQWNIHWSGSSASPIYFGVDQAWYNASVCGSSWCQPIFDFQNTIVSSTCGGVSCAGVFVQASYVTIDNLEFLHFELPNANIRNQYRADQIHGPDTGGGQTATGDVIKNCLFKDWGMEGTVTSTNKADLGQAGTVGGFSGTNALQLIGNTFDDQNGSCGSPTTGCYTGGGVSAGYITKYNVCAHTNTCFDVSVPGVLFEGNTVHDTYLSTDVGDGCVTDCGNHENQIYGKCWGYYIGNIVYNTPAGATLQLFPSSTCQIPGQTFYTANNMFDMTGTYSQCWVDRGPWNFYHYNDTCKTAGATTYLARSSTGSDCPATIHITNAHVIINNYTGSTSPQSTSGTSTVVPFANVDGGCAAPTQVTITTSVGMSTTAANAAGYSLANWWQPTTANSPTVGVGTNESSQCSGLFASLCSALNPTDPLVSLVSRLTSTSWDVGAYQFSGATDASSTTLAPPTGLTATVY